MVVIASLRREPGAGRVRHTGASRGAGAGRDDLSPCLSHPGPRDGTRLRVPLSSHGNVHPRATMTARSRPCLVCDCEGTMRLDPARLAEAGAASIHTQLCRTQLDRFRAVVAEGGPLLV